MMFAGHEIQVAEAPTRYAPSQEVADGRTDWRWLPSSPDVDHGYRLPITLIPHAEDDYGNGYADAVRRSNFRSLVRDFGTRGDGEDGVLVVVDLGMSEGLAFVGRDDTTELGEIARKLAHEYPLYDDSDHSDLEWEEQDEYLADCGVWDLKRGLPDDSPIADLDDDVIAGALREAISAHPHYGDWDGTGYRAWDDIAAAAIDRLATRAAAA